MQIHISITSHEILLGALIGKLVWFVYSYKRIRSFGYVWLDNEKYINLCSHDHIVCFWFQCGEWYFNVVFLCLFYYTDAYPQYSLYKFVIFLKYRFSNLNCTPILTEEHQNEHCWRDWDLRVTSMVDHRVMLRFTLHD